MDDLPMPNNTSAQENLIKLLQFTKWEKIPPEFRSHAITYFNGQTQFNYAQCSKLCNKEVQKMDKYVPRSLEIRCRDKHNVNISIKTKMRNLFFFDVGNNCHKYMVQSDNQVHWFHDGLPSLREISKEHLIYDGSAIEGVIRFLEQRYRNKRQRSDSEIELNFKVWPIELTQFLKRSNEWTFPIEKFTWKLAMTKSSFNGFMEVLTDDMENMRLMLLLDDFCLPSRFFQTNLFRCIDLFFCNKTNMSDDEFVQSNASYLDIYSEFITDMGINQKLIKWFFESSNVYKTFNVVKNVAFDKEAILDGLPFEDIGEESYKIVRLDGKIGQVRVRRNGVRFDSNFEGL